MNCDMFETLLPDALGDELAADRRAEFDAHATTCDRCRSEYESLVETARSLLSLPAPPDVSVVRTGGRLIIGRDSPSAGGALRSAMPPRFDAILRYAAVIALAFGAGYVARSATPTQDSPGTTLFSGTRTDEGHDREGPQPGASASLRSALVWERQRNPGRSNLTHCMRILLATGVSSAD